MRQQNLSNTTTTTGNNMTYEEAANHHKPLMISYNKAVSLLEDHCLLEEFLELHSIKDKNDARVILSFLGY